MKKQLNIIELNQEYPELKSEELHAFLENFQAALLLSLLDKGMLTKIQYQKCIDALNKK